MRDLNVTPHAHVNWVYKATHVRSCSMELLLRSARRRLYFEHQRLRSLRQRRSTIPLRRHMIGVKDAKVTGHVAIRSDAVSFRNSRADFGDSHLEGVNVSLGFHNDIVLSVAPTSKIDLANISPLASIKLAGKATWASR